MVHCVTTGIICCGFLIFVVAGQKMLGSGKWSVLNIEPCAEDAEMPWRLRVRRHRLNRTHEAFDAEVALGALLDDSYGVRAEICKRGDGGCKHFMSFRDDCLPCVIKEHAAGNLAAVLTAAGVDPPDFPIPKGEYSVRNFVLDMDDLCKEGVYGEYGVQGYVVREGRDLACVASSIRYDPVDPYSPMSPYG